MFVLQPWNLGHRTGPWITGHLSSINSNFQHTISVLFSPVSYYSTSDFGHAFSGENSKTLMVSETPKSWPKLWEKSVRKVLFAVCHQITIPVDGVFAVWKWVWVFFFESIIKAFFRFFSYCLPSSPPDQLSSESNVYFQEKRVDFGSDTSWQMV